MVSLPSRSQVAGAVVGAAALALTATTGGSQSAQAQTAPPPSLDVCLRAERDPAFKSGQDPIAAAQCVIIRSQARQAAAEAATKQAQLVSAQAQSDSADAQQQSQCARRLTDLANNNPALKEKGRVLLDGRSVAVYGACNLWRDLTSPRPGS